MYYVGMMSGTSLDGVDAVLARCQNDRWQVIQHAEKPFPDDLKQTLYDLNFADTDHTRRGGELHTAKTAEQQLTACYAEVFHQLIAAIAPTHIQAIGAHGQTIRHQPNARCPYTLQLLNGALLSHLTGQTVVCDFRSKDIAAGGQGAPLAPLFHQHLFAQQPPFAVVNIGGIANISVVGGNTSVVPLSGFDCGPGNCLLDEWISRHCGKAFDKNGQWAAGGQVLPELLWRLLSDDYFAQPAPKSSGRDYFNTRWLQRYLHADEAPQDVMRTLLELTAKAITDNLPDGLNAVILAGGGAKNHLLVQTIEANLSLSEKTAHCPRLLCSDELGIGAQQVEALGFALLAKQCLSGEPMPTQQVTGATTPVICGAIYR